MSQFPSNIHSTIQSDNSLTTDSIKLSEISAELHTIDIIRLRFLEHLELPSELFIHPVAEREWNALDPLLNNSFLGLSDIEFFLETNSPLFIVGRSGTGKTFSRFWLEQYIHQHPQQIAVVLTGLPPSVHPSLNEVIEALTHATILDILLYWLSQPPDSALKFESFLRKWFIWGGERIADLCDALLLDPLPICTIVWQIAQRRVHLNPLSSYHQAILQQLISLDISDPPPASTYIKERWLTLLQEIATIGIVKLVFLADYFHASYTQIQLDIICHAVLDNSLLPSNLIAFLPHSPIHAPKTLKIKLHELKWNRKTLITLLERRVRSLDPEGCELHDLIHPDVVNALILHSNSSPRRLLALINTLFENHIRVYGDRLPIKSVTEVEAIVQFVS